MIITKMSLHRRTFLRGVGTALALPLLDAMVPALSAMAGTAGNPVRRLGFVYVPNGINPGTWNPAGDGGQLALSPTLQPLGAFQDRMVVVSRLASVPAEAQGDGAGDHARASAAWLTGVHPKRTEGPDYRAGKTVDQYAADELGKSTVLPSLQVSVDSIGGVGLCEGGYACSYQNTLSWRTPTTPLPMQNNPRVVFERLFGDASNPAERRLLAQAQGSILDSIAEAATRLQSRLGAGDRRRMTEYLDGIRELEQRIQKIEQHSDLDVVAGDRPVGIPDAYDEHVKLMFDLQLIAWQADLTRVSTFLMSRETSQRTYPQIGVPDAHHGLSHHGEDPEKLQKLAAIDKYHVELFGYYVKKLAETNDGAGSLLDHSLIMYGSCISNGNNHSHRNLPALLVGSAVGRVKGNRHIVCAADTPLTNLQVALLDKIGVRVDQFGDSNGTVAEL
jgi:hypothetical protein